MNDSLDSSGWVGALLAVILVVGAIILSVAHEQYQASRPLWDMMPRESRGR